MLTTVITSWIILKQYPNFSIVFATAFVTLGAIVAGVETVNSDMLGYGLVTCNNLSQSLYNAFVAKAN